MRRISGISIILWLLIGLTPVRAQVGYTPRKKTPRAVGVLEFDNLGRPRLVPVSLYMDGKFYDAGLYMSKPSPVVLDTDTVYEVVKAGVPQGLFTVQESRRVDKGWWGIGKWKPYNSSDPAEKKADKPKDASKGDDDEDRPILKRKPTADDGTVTIQTEKGKPEVVNTTPSKEEPAAPPPDDTDRPVLSRTNAPKVQKEEPISFVTKIPGTELFTPAISDSEQLKGRPYGYEWDDSDRERLTQGMKQFAAAELRKALTQRRWPVPAPSGDQKQAPSKGRTKSAKPAGAPDPLIAELRDVKIAAYDLDYNNSPQIVFSARYMPPTEGLSESDVNLLKSHRGVSVTVVGRLNFENVLQQIFAEVSDPRQLDLHPEFAFVDAVDVDGDSRGELLFQRITETGRGFVIYRVAGQSMGELFATIPR